MTNTTLRGVTAALVLIAGLGSAAAQESTNVVATEGEIKTATHNLAVRERKITRQEEAQRALSDKISGKVAYAVMSLNVEPGAY